ncbi:hypothetical protein GCK32_019066, partial [Trichostrongylus colubriformis]
MDGTLEEQIKKRKAEEIRLIEQLRWKRACVRLMPTLPTEEEVQKKIQKFLELILTITRSNNLKEESAKLFAQRLTLFAKREGTLYKCKVQNIQMEVQFVKERILSAVQGMAMCNETYGLLVLAKVATEESKGRFYDQSHDGIPLEPAFVNEFVGKEIEFLDELLRRIDTELCEASQQIANEDHGSIYENILQTMAQFQKSLEQLDKTFSSQLQQQRETLAQLNSSMEAIEKRFESFKSMTRSGDEVDQEEANEDTQSKRSDGDIVEDLWEAGNEDATPPPENDNEKTHGESRKEPHEGEQQSKEREDDGQNSETKGKRNLQQRLTERLEEIRRKINDRRLPPQRIFTMRNEMRRKEQFLKCAFCDVKGLHYSDSCPEYRSVEDRTERIRCKLCLDTKHRTRGCRKAVYGCKYCKSRKHHTALCSLPQKRGELECEYSELKKILQSINADCEPPRKREGSTTPRDDDADRPSTSRRAEYHEQAVDKLEAPLNDEERERVEEHVEKASSLLLESEALVAQIEEDGEEIMESVDVHAVLSSPELEITDVIDLQRFSSLTKAKSTMDGTLEEQIKKRKAEEIRLIEQLRWKRACVRLMPTLPTEEEVQKKIQKFLELILTITRSNNLKEESAKLFAQRLTLFAKREGTLYKCKVQNIQMEVQFVKERILSAVQGMAMCNETYGLLVLAKVATEESKGRFYDQSHDGIPLEPAFVNEFVGKEIEFLDELLRRIDTELCEASQQIANEDHGSIYENILQTMAQFQKSLEQLDKTFSSQLQQQRETLAQLNSSMEAIEKRFESFKSMTRSGDEVDQEEANEDTQSKRSDGDIVEDLWEA